MSQKLFTHHITLLLRFAYLVTAQALDSRFTPTFNSELSGPYFLDNLFTFYINISDTGNNCSAIATTIRESEEKQRPQSYTWPNSTPGQIRTWCASNHAKNFTNLLNGHWQIIAFSTTCCPSDCYQACLLAYYYRIIEFMKTIMREFVKSPQWTALHVDDANRTSSLLIKWWTWDFTRLEQHSEIPEKQPLRIWWLFAIPT